MLRLLLPLLFFAACAADAGSPAGPGGAAGAGLRCGPGTTQVGDQCVVAAGGQAGGYQCGKGTHPVGDACEADGPGGKNSAGAAGTAGAAGQGGAGYPGKNNWGKGGVPGAGGGFGDGGAGGMGQGAGGDPMGAGGAVGCDVVACSHDLCAEGEKLVPGCSPCASVVCAADPYCCDNTWDAQCIGAAKQQCPCDCQGGMMPGPEEPVCDAPAEAPSAGACVAVGGDVACNPVTSAECKGEGEACDYSDKGFACYPPPNTAGPCEPCGNAANGAYCKPGHTCIQDRCHRYCCDDGDCGPGGLCSKNGGASGVCIKNKRGAGGAGGQGGGMSPG